MHRSFAAGMAILLAIAVPAAAAETPKRGGTLSYMIPADAPPSFDGHREATFATVHAVAQHTGVANGDPIEVEVGTVRERLMRRIARIAAAGTTGGVPETDE